MSKLMTSVSGVRGIFGDTLNPFIAAKYIARFGMLVGKGTVVIGRDSRTTGESLLSLACSILSSVGCDVVDLGIVPTPTVLLAVRHHNAVGGIAITASHNPPEWNAMKFVDGDGMFLSPERAFSFLNSVEEPIAWVGWDQIGKITKDHEAITRHIDRILAIPYIDLDKIRSKRFRVALDSVNGAGGLSSPLLLEALGCEIVQINSEPTGIFAHPAEPLNHNLVQLENAVRCSGAMIGFATDPDVDRLSIVSDKGLCIGEELSVALAEKYVLSKHPTDVVVNLSSSMISEDIAAEFGVKVHRTKVGEINVGKKMQEIDSSIGGEGNGGIICPPVNYTRDAMAGMALILGLLAETGLTLSEIVATLPKYYFAKGKMELKPDQLDSAMNAVSEVLSGYEFDLQDGIKALGDKHWIHIRKSGTEPIIRVYVESESQERSESICNSVMQRIIAKL